MLSTLPADGISSAYRKLHTWWQHLAALTGGMSSSEPARAAGRRTRSRILAAALVLVTAALIGVLGCSSLAASSLSATSPEPTALRPRALRPADSPPRDRQGAPGEADVAVPDGTTVFDDDISAVANLDPRLLRALRRAATDAAGDGIEFYVYSGWRSGRTRNNCSVRPSRSTARKQPDGLPPWAPLLTKGETRSTSALRCHGVAIQTRRQIRGVPDLPQRTLALRATSQRRRSRLPGHVRRPYAGSTDAPMICTLGIERPSTQSPDARDKMRRSLWPPR